jgi:RHS repeat-associated protein
MVYNYYSSVPASTSCATPSQGSGNNRQIVNYVDFGNGPAGTWSNTSHTGAYTYDSLNRLTSVVAAPVGPGTVSENLTFSYDRYGNMTCVVNAGTNGFCAPVTFDAATNHMTATGPGIPTYDTDGNVITDVTRPNYYPNTYSYDAEGRLIGVTNTNHNSASYTYNALGQLVEMNESNYVGPDAEIMYDPSGRKIAKYNNASAQWIGEYFPLNSQPIAFYNLAPDVPGYDTGGTYDIFRNPLGSMRYDDASGDAARNESLYSPWGNNWYLCLQVIGYSSFGAFDPYCACTAWEICKRSYNPDTGRWMSPDSDGGQVSDPQTLNRHAYADNDPVNLVDPDGMPGVTPTWGFADPGKKKKKLNPCQQARDETVKRILDKNDEACQDFIKSTLEKAFDYLNQLDARRGNPIRPSVVVNQQALSTPQALADALRNAQLAKGTNPDSVAHTEGNTTYWDPHFNDPSNDQVETMIHEAFHLLDYGRLNDEVIANALGLRYKIVQSGPHAADETMSNASEAWDPLLEDACGTL